MARTAVAAEASDRIGLLDKERIIAPPGYNRWLVPPAALAIHLCIGMAYGFSVFWLPLGRAVGVAQGLDKPIPCPGDATTFFGKVAITAHALFATDCDWTQFDLGWMFTLFFVLLGVSAAIWGGWLERVGPRKAGVVAAICWGGGLLISAVGVYIHQLWLMWLGSGIIGGCGLGLGYISPVSTLIKWFPDRRGMATGMAIMGFGGGAMIGSPLATLLMNHYATPTSVGVWETFVTMGVIYFVFMMCGAFGYRLPPTGWKPRRLDAAGERQGDDHHRARPPEGRPQDRAILADLGCALPQCLRRHRHHRRRRAHAAGDLRRAVVRRPLGRLRQLHRRAEGQGGFGRRGLRGLVLAVQHRRPLLLGLAVGQDRAEGDLFHLLHARLHLLRGRADAGDSRPARAVRGSLLPHRLDVWRRLRHHSGLSRRHLRHAIRRRHPWPASHRLVDRRHRRPGDRELHARLAESRGRVPRPDLPSRSSMFSPGCSWQASSPTC